MKSIKNLAKLLKKSSTVAKNASRTVGDDLVDDLKNAGKKAVNEAKKHADSVDDALKSSTAKAHEEVEKLKELRNKMNVNSKPKEEIPVVDKDAKVKQKKADNKIKSNKQLPAPEAEEVVNNTSSASNNNTSNNNNSGDNTSRDTSSANSREAENKYGKENIIDEPEFKVSEEAAPTSEPSSSSSGTEHPKETKALTVVDSVEDKTNSNKKESIFDKIFDITDDDEKFFGKNIKLKKKYLTMGTAAVLGTAVVGSGAKHISRRNLGEINAGVSVGTINATFSPTHNKMMNYAQTPDGLTAFDNHVAGRGSSTSVAGADAEIVFALHELRNGGV